MSDRQVVGVKRDLLLLENQVPFPVLQSLMRLRLILTGKKRKASASGYDWQLQAAQQPAHLLELLLSLFICSHKSEVKSSPRRYAHCFSYLVTCCKKIIPTKPKPVVARESHGHYLYYSAKNLKKPLLLNLVAYETSAALDQLPVTSYICFMDSLIDDADDVKELRSNGIIVNFHGSEHHVADLFNNMGSSLEPDTSAYNDVKREINRQYESTLKRWVAEMQQTYFHSPWAFLAFAAAAVGLALTATQLTQVPRLLHTSSLKADQEGQQPNASWDRGNQEGKQQNPSATYSKGSTFASTDSKNQKCYDPSLVSIGPYHHGKHELRDMEMLKVTFTSKFVDDSGLSIQYTYGKVAEVATDPRRYYAKDSTDEFDDEKFTQIMFLDGCFILQFIFYFLNRLEDLNMPGHHITLVKRDLLLLENQVPFQVIWSLMDLRFGKGEAGGGNTLTDDYIRHIRALPPRQESFKEMIKKFVGKCIWKQPQICGVPIISPWNKLILSPITIEESFKAVLLNLIAYETCYHASGELSVTSYACFLDSLIQDVEDVKVLQSEGVLNIFVREQEVADLFNQMSRNLVPNPYAYSDVKRRIELDRKSIIKKWASELMQTYFSNPWSFIALVAATFTIILTVIQSYLAVFPTNDCNCD
ncbi:hypothetical protein DKX38_023657 [Salix brachista]|uniref:Uncharacterized protein n=1 Tax=Salix brachista TaxID=2182728 RepID=A0A5N5JJE6_9ROSI|nr:hypothetical protein DKX38_023657 [Salix brachista]